MPGVRAERGARRDAEGDGVRSPVLRIHADELVIDSFAGGGGASLGIEWALGRSPDIAVNHDAHAIAMHQANHPTTRHLHGDVWDVDPKGVCGGRAVGLAWFSPDCKHFSKAKGGKPVEKKIRGLAWVVVRWGRAVKPRVIILENVEEFADWGPLLEDGRPDPARRGLTFRRWLGQLHAAGYVTEVRELRACDYGAPTSRKRLFVIARCDGQPIVWPAASHHPGTHRSAAECIDWTLPCPSIFERARPLAEKTLARVARGIDRFVVGTTPFIAPSGRVMAPTLIQTGYGERVGQAPRVLDLRRPLGTVVAGGQKHALVAAFLAKHYGGVVGSSLFRPVATITTQDHHSLVEARLGAGARAHEVRAFLTRYNGVGDGQPLQLPLGTIMTRDRFGLVRVHGAAYEIADIGMRMLAPRELFRAQGFPDSYQIDRAPDGGALTKTTQIRLCGNSVCPPIAAALVRANLAAGEVAAA